MEISIHNNKLANTNGKLRRLSTLSLFLLAFLFVIYPGSAGATGDPISIYAPQFDATTITAFQLNGHAVRTTDNKLLLTDGIGQTGSTFWKSRIYLGTDKSFSAYFTFLINNNVGGGADGLAFVIQTSTVDAGSAGGGMGYQGITPSIAVEFDTWQNVNDINDNHIAIVEDGTPDVAHTTGLYNSSPGFTLDGGTIGHVWVDFDGATKKFEVRLSTTTTRPTAALISCTKDLAAKFGINNVYVGFTAATGGSGSNHYLQDLLFENSYVPSGVDPSGSYEQAGAYTITYHVTSDGSTALAGASVAVNGVTLTTDANGNASISLAEGIYPYTVSKTLYTSVTGTTTVNAAPVTQNITLVIPPTITVSQSSLNLGYVASGGTSGEMSYTLSGIALSPSSGNITITPPANFEVSFTSGSGFSASALTKAYTSGTLTATTIYVRFKPTGTTTYSGSITNSGGTATTQNVSLTGTSALSYCSASTSYTQYMGINRVVFNTIDKTTNNTNSSYNDFSGINTSVTKGQSYTLSVYGWGYNQYFKAWFDWNNDGDFADSGEEFSIGGDGYSSSTSIPIPSGSITGNVRMRVRSNYQSSALPLACGAVDYGECEDYTVIVEDSAPIVWDGSESTDWNTPGNWSTNAVPTVSDNASIPDGTNDPTVNQTPGTPATCNNLTIGDGAVLTIASGKALTVNGTLINTLNNGLIINNGGSLINGSANVPAKVQSTIPGNQWHLISAPVSGATSLMFLHKYLQMHTESSNLYTDITPTTGDLTPMKGFALWGDASGFIATYTGTLNKGNQTYSTTASSYSSPNGGFNLVGNPYPSSIDWLAATGWTKTGVNNAIYIHVSSSSWATFIGGTGVNGGTRYIAPGQGFFVQATSAGTLAMTDAVRVHNATTFFKNTDEVIPKLVKLEVSGNGYRDEAVVRFLPDATSEFDGNYDAHKLYGDVPEAAQLYSFGSTALAINSLPETDEVMVGIKAGASGNYTIAATEINDLAEVTLEDIKTGIFTELTDQAYSFNFEAGENELRFNLHFNTMLGVSDKKDVSATIYSYRKTTYINLMNGVKGDIYIYNVAGQLVATKLSAKGMNEIGLKNTGIYIVKVVTDKSSQMKKIFIR